MQNCLISTKDSTKNEFDIEDWLDEFLVFYNDKKHSATKYAQRRIAEMTYDKENKLK